MSAKLIVANWKMNPASAAQAGEILSRVDDYLRGAQDGAELPLVICPPFVFLDEVSALLQTGRLRDCAVLGAQDISAKDEGALTGEVSGPQLVRSDVRYVIVGHSERRYKLGEDDAMVNEKLKAALRNGLIPVLCVGERSRDEGWQELLDAQIRSAVDGIPTADISRIVVAYEPVWAISTNPGAKADSPESARDAAGRIPAALGASPRALLYGGSVTPENASGFLSIPLFGGVLVGGASVRPDDFVGILRAEAERMRNDEQRS